MDQGLTVGHVEAVAIEVSEHPLVGIEAVAVGELDSVLKMPEFGTQRSRPRHGCVNMEP